VKNPRNPQSEKTASSLRHKDARLEIQTHMDLVDLRGRQDEASVVRVLGQSHGRVEALEEAQARYRSGEWMFLGWEVAGDVVACAGAEPAAGRTIGIRPIAVAPAWRNQGLARALIDALAERGDAKRVVAETDDDAVDFYRRCGFSIEDAQPKFGRARYWCVQERG
jgi:ribosomal protein S18 acetylase RimI-like enzyme